jgi:DNA-binding NarL/FixJ family response regulator
MGKKITILLADDHEMVRQGVRTLLETERDFSIVGETGDGLSAVRLVGEFKPDILLTELVLSGLSGLEVTRQVCRKALSTRVIIFTMYQEERRVREALQNGASGYVLKSAFATHLIKAIHKVKAGERYLSPPLHNRDFLAISPQTRAEPLNRCATLTTREREVLQMSAEGDTLAEIASRLSISPRTVETHRANLMRKLGFRTQTDLIRYAIVGGILPPWTDTAIPLEPGQKIHKMPLVRASEGTRPWHAKRD